MTSATPAAVETDAEDLSKRIVVLRLEMGAPGTKGAVDTDDVMEDEAVDSKSIHISKDIFKSSALRKIRSTDHIKRIFIREHRGVPCEIARGGYYPISVALIEDVENNILKPYANETRPALIEEFVAEYPQLITDARTRLGPHFDANDYPPVNKLRSMFYMKWRWMSFELPGNALRSVSNVLYERERKKTMQMWEEARAQIVTALRHEFQGLVNHMSNKLNPPSGKKMVVRHDMTKGITEFLSMFPFRNVTDDAELSNLITQTKGMLKGVDPVSLKDEEFAKEVSKRFDSIKVRIDKLVEEAPIRAISFE